MSGYLPPDGHDVQLAGKAWESVDGHALALRYEPPRSVVGVADGQADPSLLIELYRDVAAMLAPTKESVGDFLTAANFWQEEQTGDLRGLLDVSREYAIGDVVSILSTIKEKAVDSTARLARLSQREHDLLAFNVVAKEIFAADGRAFMNFEVARAISDMLGHLREQIEGCPTNLTGDLSVARERLSDALGSLRTGVETAVNAIAAFPWLQQYEVADGRLDLSTAINFHADAIAVAISLIEAEISDTLSKQRFYQDNVVSADLYGDIAEALLVTADLLGDISRLLEVAADVLATFPKEQSGVTDSWLDLALFRPRQIHIPTAGGDGHALTLYAAKDRMTGEPIISSPGHNVHLKGRSDWVGIEPGWETDALISLGIPPSAWWKMASAQVLARLPWKIKDIGLVDIRADLMRPLKQVADFAAMLSVLGEAPADFIGKLGIKLTDEEWNAVRRKVEILTRKALTEIATRDSFVDILTALVIIEIAKREVETEILAREVE